jgi:hypothetical protein
MNAGFTFKIVSSGSLNGTVPAGQIQLILDELATGEVCSDGHWTQVAADVAAEVVEYVPDPQFVHVVFPVPIL